MARFGRGGPGVEPRLRGWGLRSLRLWVAVTVGVLLAAVVLSAAGTLVAHARQQRAQQVLREHLRPAQRAVVELTAAYADQETGQRGFLLTGQDSFLAPYASGLARSQQLSATLAGLLPGYPALLTDLSQVNAAGQLWRIGAAEPEIAARRDGPLSPGQAVTFATTGKPLFDVLRTRLAALTADVDTLTTAELARFDSAQVSANTTAVLALSLAVLACVVIAVLLALFVSGPLRRLLVQVQAVSAGAYEQPIRSAGPAEFARIAAAVEHMRQTILAGSRRLVDTERELGVRDERDRLAGDLHDLTIQRIFALGLALSSLAGRAPLLAADLDPLIDETDAAIRELRGVIFALGRERPAATPTARAAELVRDSIRALSFTPSLVLHEHLDQVDAAIVAELLSVLREALSNIARHAQASSAMITVSVTDGSVHLSVSDDGRGVTANDSPGDGLRNMRERAERLGGTAAITTNSDGGTSIAWQVPR